MQSAGEARRPTPLPIPCASPPSRPSRSRSFLFSSMIWASSLSSSAVISLIVDGGEGGASAPCAFGSAPAFAAGFRFFFAGGGVFCETSFFCGLAFAGAAGAEGCSRTVGRAAEPPSPPPTNGLAGGLGAYASARPGAAAVAAAAASLGLDLRITAERSRTGSTPLRVIAAFMARARPASRAERCSSSTRKSYGAGLPVSATTSQAAPAGGGGSRTSLVSWDALKAT